MRLLLLHLLLPLLLCSCASQMTESTKVIDGTNETTTVTSMRLMASNLPRLEQCHLEVAFAKIRLGDPTMGSYTNLGKKLNGMTAQQIIIFAKQFPELPAAEVQCAP